MQRIVCLLSIALLSAGCASQKAPEKDPADLPDSVVAALRGVNMPGATHPLAYLETVKESTGRKAVPSQPEERFLAVDAPTGQLFIQTERSNFRSNGLSFRGLIFLQGVINGPMAKGVSFVSDLSFSGDWQHLPVGGKLSYVTHVSHRYTGFGEGETTVSQSVTSRCTVTRELPAREVNQALSGSAKELVCADDDDRLAYTSTFYYLQDYAYFFNARSVSPTLGGYEMRLVSFK